jgi:PBP1b-binding outer membrane lipoprotein LpoB
MKTITKVFTLFLALAFFLSSCVMGGGDDEKKDPADNTDTPDRVDPEPPDSDAPDIDIDVSDTVYIN